MQRERQKGNKHHLCTRWLYKAKYRLSSKWTLGKNAKFREENAGLMTWNIKIQM